MPALHRAAAMTTDLACGLAGRRQVMRASRFVLMRARRDVPNDPATNGEGSLQRWVVGLSPRPGRIRVLDVGANVGRWSVAMLAAAQQAGRLADLDLHSFEPSAFTFGRLRETLREQDASLVRAALSDQAGSAVLHVAAPGAGTNSLHRPPTCVSTATEEVPVTTLEAYADRVGIDDVRLVKIDAEGHDLAVLRGARQLFARQRICVAQFEYNHRWIYARCFLRDAFDLLQPLGYRIGKLTPAGVEFYPRWDPDLETFTEGNYVACRPEISQRLPTVTWWKARLIREEP
jgi:FkbM family methyltransferase